MSGARVARNRLTGRWSQRARLRDEPSLANVHARLAAERRSLALQICSAGLRRSILCLMVIMACAGQESSLPSEWRLPTDEELAGEPLRKDSPTRFARAVADFNADGSPDEALLVKSTRFSGEGLLVRLSCGHGCANWITLATTNWGQYRDVPVSMGVDVLAPGTHEYKCVDEGGSCQGPLVRPTMTLETPAISYFRFESASSFFYWNDRRFIRVWTSD
jgi:hypothetical protein